MSNFSIEYQKPTHIEFQSWANCHYTFPLNQIVLAGDFMGKGQYLISCGSHKDIELTKEMYFAIREQLLQHGFLDSVIPTKGKTND